ncbi:hypothetical protein ACLOJK_002809 [Asimina triloba]
MVPMPAKVLLWNVPFWGRGYTLMGRGLSLADRVFIPRWVVDRSVMSYVGEPSDWARPSGQ